MLAGVSVDYYARLEQGRERHPSGSVLDALSRALDLDAEAREHLHRLAGVVPAAAPPDVREVVDDGLLRLLDSWPDTPALIINRRLDILAANGLAAALHSDFARPDNLVRMTFLDPVGATYFVDWRRAAEACVANLRYATGLRPRDPVTLALVDELRACSDAFRDLWESHAVRGKVHEAKAFRHREVGELVLDHHAFEMRLRPDQQLVVYSAAPGSASADALRLLGTLAATRDTSLHRGRS